MSQPIRLKKQQKSTENDHNDDIKLHEESVPEIDTQEMSEQPNINDIVDPDDQLDNLDADDQFEDQIEDQMSNPNYDDFLPLPPDYIIRQQQIASYQMLCQFLVYQEKNIADVLNDVRVSIDCLTKCVMQLNKTLEKQYEQGQRKNI
jgi:hypothetical protein